MAKTYFQIARALWDRPLLHIQLKRRSIEEERMNACCPIFKENLHKEQDVCFSKQKKEKGNSFYVYL